MIIFGHGVLRLSTQYGQKAGIRMQQVVDLGVAASLVRQLWSTAGKECVQINSAGIEVRLQLAAPRELESLLRAVVLLPVHACCHR